MAKKDIETDNRPVTARSVAESALPGWTAVREVSLDHEGEQESASAFHDTPMAPRSDAVMPSVEQLRAKYLSAYDQSWGAQELSVEPDPVATHDTKLVEMKAGPLRKTVAVSLTQKKVLWSQG